MGAVLRSSNLSRREGDPRECDCVLDAHRLAALTIGPFNAPLQFHIRLICNMYAHIHGKIGLCVHACGSSLGSGVKDPAVSRTTNSTESHAEAQLAAQALVAGLSGREPFRTRLGDHKPEGQGFPM